MPFECEEKPFNACISSQHSNDLWPFRHTVCHTPPWFQRSTVLHFPWSCQRLNVNRRCFCSLEETHLRTSKQDMLEATVRVRHYLLYVYVLPGVVGGRHNRDFSSPTLLSSSSHQETNSIHSTVYALLCLAVVRSRPLSVIENSTACYCSTCTGMWWTPASQRAPCVRLGKASVTMEHGSYLWRSTGTIGYGLLASITGRC